MTAPGSTVGRWRLAGLGTGGGAALAWTLELLGLSHDDVDMLAAESAAGAGGVLFVPTMAGAFFPRRSPRARGAILGLTSAHGRPDLVRAVLEGVAFEMEWMARAMREQGLDPSELRLAGGGARSRAWCKIQADVHGLPVVRRTETHQSLLGAACYAASAVGLVEDPLLAARAWSADGETFAPSAEAHAFYREASSRYARAVNELVDSKLDERLFEIRPNR
jgi:xylulokinase